MNRTPVDVSELAWERPPVPTVGAPVPRRWLTRYVLPALILFGFCLLIGLAIGEQWQSRVPVQVAPVMVVRGQQKLAGTPLFQAAGWIEPRPTPVAIAALTEGVLSNLLVVEGQSVQQGQPIANLISVDAELALRQAETALKIRQGELQRVKAEAEAATIRLQQPVHLESQLAEAESKLAAAKTAASKLPFLIKTALANSHFTSRNLQRKKSIEDAIAGIQLEEAERDHAAATSELEELQQRDSFLKQEIDTLALQVSALRRRLELLVDERQQQGEAIGKVAAAEALLEQAELDRERAKLALDRTVVRAPISGRILRLIAAPGSRVMGLEQSATQSSSTVALMYDPLSLQVRADVRLEDVPLVTNGAPVEIETPSAKNKLRGRVLQPTRSANIQKNTLEVKVEILDPPETIAPEMLVTATFLVPNQAATADEVEVDLLLIPYASIVQNQSEPYVWCVNDSGHALQQEVHVGTQRPDGLVNISGLNPTDKVIVNNHEKLREGQPVVVVADNVPTE